MAKIFISSGEHSGDFYGAELAYKLKSLDGSLEISGIGSKCMKDAGVNLLYNSAEWSSIGLIESLVKIPKLFLYFRRIKDYIKKNNIDVVILIDFPAFNMRLAGEIKKLGIKSFYYFPPSAWSKNLKRAINVSSTVNKVITTFNYTYEMYKKAGLNPLFFGHPILDSVKVTSEKEKIFSKFDFSSDKFFLSIFPGSRSHEIYYNLPVMIEACKTIQEKFSHLQFAISAVSPFIEKKIRFILEKYNFKAKIISGDSHNLMSISSFIIVTSGTATLEAACLNIPMVIVYRISSFSWFVARNTIELPDYAGLPNLILQKKIVPELIQNDFTFENLANIILDFLSNPDKIDKMKTNLKEVVNNLGPSGASENIAREIIKSVMREA